MMTAQRALLSLVAACVLLWPAPGLASQSPEEPAAPTLPEASQISGQPVVAGFYRLGRGRGEQDTDHRQWRYRSAGMDDVCCHGRHLPARQLDGVL